MFCHLKSVSMPRPLLRHRKLFREEVLSWLTRPPVRLHSLSPLEKKSVLSPGRPVIFEEGGRSLCVSHCPYLMGCVFLQGPGQVSLGFDLEKPDRISPGGAARILGRVASKKEREQAPHPVALWSAKEAAFKSLCPPQGGEPLSPRLRFSEGALLPKNTASSSARDTVPPPPGGEPLSPRPLFSAEPSLPKNSLSASARGIAPPPSLKDISILNWQKQNSHTFRFDFAPTAGGTAPVLKGQGRGLVLFFDFVLVCLAGLWF